MKVFLETTFDKCANNVYYLAQIKEFIRGNGIELVEDESGADVIVIVTCGYSENEENRSIETIEKRASRRKPGSIVVVTGCLPKISPEKMEMSGVTAVGLQELQKLNEIFKPVTGIEVFQGNRLGNMLGHGFKDDYYVQICQGCTNSCSYCSIKKAKGYVTSRKIEDIAEDVKRGAMLGFKRFVLLADDCGSYGSDIGTDFSELINHLAKMEGGIEFNIHYMFPGTLLKLYPKIDRDVWKRVYYMCCPLQSTSPRILKLMNRNYDIGKVVDVVSSIKSVNPSIYLETHIIFGFPSETMGESFGSFFIKDHFDDVMFIAYSDRSGTSACGFPGKLSDEEIKHRAREITKECRKHRTLGILDPVDDENAA